MPPAKLAVAKAAASISAWRAAIRGGSFAAAVAPKKTRDGKALLVSMPQLEKSYPSLLWELEIHGAGYDARGVSVPGLPTVGIGYNARVAWALTTGYSKTIDSFIETSRANPVPGRPPQYFHNGAWRDQHCREEVVRYRLAPQGVPVGPPVLQQPLQVCRTVHGPVVSTTTGKSRSVQYAMWGKEIDTIEGILGWNRARNLSEFVAGVRKVTWNENVTWADADGHIGYWHPGIHPMRDAGSDQRLPAPGTGEYDHVRLLTTDEMPHVIDPAQGYLANWNNKPAHGWLDGEGIGYASRPAGKYHRVLNLMDQLAARDDWDFAALRTLDRRAGTRDVRASLYLPLLRRLAASPGLSTRERDLLDLVLAWDGTHYGPGAGTSADGLTDGPAVTIFAAFVDAVRDDLLGGIPEAFRARQTNEESSHVYDATAVDNLVARILDPTASSLTPSRDYTHGRTANAVLKAAFDAALATLADEYGTSDRDAWRRRHPTIEICSLTGGVIGPCVVMPYFDRGSWTHLVGFTAPHRAPGTGGGGGPGGGGQGSGGGAGLPSTGPDPRRTALALLLTAVAAAAIRRARLSRPAGSPMRRE
jgi:acyl-homoserine lactone acylase PvdQ